MQAGFLMPTPLVADNLVGENMAEGILTPDHLSWDNLAVDYVAGCFEERNIFVVLSEIFFLESGWREVYWTADDVLVKK